MIPPSRTVPALLATALLLSVVCTTVFAQQASVLGLPVRQISFRPDSPFDTAHLNTLVAVKIGQPLTVRVVQDSIRNLFATGDFRDIRVEAAPLDGGLDLTFTLSLNYRVDSIAFDGMSSGERQSVARDLVVHTGDVLSLNAVDRSSLAVQSDLARRGYLDATVDPETRYGRSGNLANVIFHVIRGTAANVGTVTITGDPAPFQADQLIQKMKRGPGRRYDADQARNDANRIAEFLFGQDYRKADVRYLGQKYDAATKTVALSYRVATGPKVAVEVVGTPRDAVRKLIPFRRNQSYSADVIDRGANRVLVEFQKRGYFQAAVDTDEELVGGNWVITYRVASGRRLTLARVDFAGNKQLSDRQLSKVITTAPSGGFQSTLASLIRRASGVTTQQLRDDRDRLESYYRIQGFAQARIADAVTKEIPGNGLEIAFPITEGPRTILSEVRVEGNEKVAGRDLPPLELKAGQPLNPQRLRDDLIALQAYYADHGYSEARVTYRPESSPDNTSARITYEIAEGPLIRIDEVIVRGNTYTKTPVVLRKAELTKGAPFSYGALLEAQQSLYRLGIFQRVDVQPQHAGVAVDTRDIVIQVEEGKDLTVSGAVGLSSGVESTDRTLKPRGSVSVSHRNLFGTGRYLGFDAIAGADNQLFLTYREPFILNLDVPVQLSLFRTDDRSRPDIARIRQRGVSIELQRIWQSQARWSLRYEYKISECVPGTELCDQATALTPIPGLPRELQNVHIASLTPTFFQDKRDDPLNPHRGFFTTASVQYAFPVFTAKTKFVKESGQGSWYLPLSARSTFVLSGRLGFIQPGSAPAPGLAPVPFAERFTAGGESSHRAYTLDHLGLLATDCGSTHGCETIITVTDPQTGHVTYIPIGGDGLAIVNAEYRYPIVSSLGGAVFVDGGNVWRQASDIRLQQFRWGIGTGFRYLSPVGPARLDFGYKLKKVPKAFEGRWGIFFTLGFPF
jgi:outer membrane protein insertion porin family